MILPSISDCLSIFLLHCLKSCSEFPGGERCTVFALVTFYKLSFPAAIRAPFQWSKMHAILSYWNVPCATQLLKNLILSGTSWNYNITEWTGCRISLRYVTEDKERCRSPITNASIVTPQRLTTGLRDEMSLDECFTKLHQRSKIRAVVSNSLVLLSAGP